MSTSSTDSDDESITDMIIVEQNHENDENDENDENKEETAPYSSSPPLYTRYNSVFINSLSTSSNLLEPLFRLLDIGSFSSFSIEDSIIQDVAHQSMESYWSELNPRDPKKKLAICKNKIHVSNVPHNVPHNVSNVPIHECHQEVLYQSASYSLEKCFICFETFIEKEPLILLYPCLHLFHEPCIQEAIHYQSKCPLCRREIRVENVENVENSVNYVNSENSVNVENVENLVNS